MISYLSFMCRLLSIFLEKSLHIQCIMGQYFLSIIHRALCLKSEAKRSKSKVAWLTLTKGEARVIHVIRDLPDFFHFNCDSLVCMRET